MENIWYYKFYLLLDELSIRSRNFVVVFNFDKCSREILMINHSFTLSQDLFAITLIKKIIKLITRH